MTLGNAFEMAVDMCGRFGDGEAAIVATEFAEECQRRGDLIGFDTWNRVSAMITYLAQHPMETRH
jgi:hypothetical protein